MPDETTARDVAVVVVPVIREPEKMTVVKRVAGVHSIYQGNISNPPLGTASAAKFTRTDNAQNHAQRHRQHHGADGFVQQRRRQAKPEEWL